MRKILIAFSYLSSFSCLSSFSYPFSVFSCRSSYQFNLLVFDFLPNFWLIIPLITSILVLFLITLFSFSQFLVLIPIASSISLQVTFVLVLWFSSIPPNIASLVIACFDLCFQLQLQLLHLIIYCRLT